MAFLGWSTQALTFKVAQLAGTGFDPESTCAVNPEVSRPLANERSHRLFGGGDLNSLAEYAFP